MQSEKDIERKLNEGVARVGGWSIKLLPFLVAGLPDRMCLFPGGRIAFVEVKGEREKPRPVQLKIMKRLKGLGFKVLVIDTVEKVRDFLVDYDPLLN